MPAIAGYEILRELGRGGMGGVFQARDLELNRMLAVKVLLEQHRGKEELERRFREEAQITGQLQHPGVPPVHEIGMLSDGRPFFAMKLIEGRTLAELLQQRPAPTSDLPRFLSIFELICQTLAYAHSCGVIHRDLKPSNIMVGAFGEVQVMDWGLAKVRGGAAASDMFGAGTQGITTMRTHAPWLLSHAGAVLGTPAYMAPEQARGDIEQLDERCDVFGLGAILTVILTGAPPYLGAGAAAVMQQAAQGDLADAYVRLDSCGADPELIKLARACLAARVEVRLPDAAAVAKELSAYLDSMREKLRRAELERAAADLRVVEERKRRRLTVVLATVAVAALVLAVVGWRFIEQTRAAYRAQTAVQVNQELGRAASLGDQARAVALGNAATRDTSARLWGDALAAVDRVEAILATAPADVDTQLRVASTAAAMRSEAAEIARDRTMLERLEAARDQRTIVTDADADRMNQRSFIVYGHAAGEAYATAFRDYGIDVLALTPAEAAERIRQRSIRIPLAAALDDWLILAVDQPLAQKLVAVARAGDDDPFRTRLREAVAAVDRTALVKLARESASVALSVPIAVLLADGLHLAGEHGTAVEVLERAREHHLDDFWVNDILGVFLFYADPSRVEEAGRCFAAALARRPDCFFIHSNLGVALDWQCRWPEAIKAYERSIEMKPDFLRGRIELAVLLAQQGNLDRAVALCEEAARLRPGDTQVVAALARFRVEQGRKAEAIKLARDLVARAPKLSAAHTCLGDVLLQTGAADQAAAAYREALKRNPFLIAANTGLAYALVNQNQVAEARQALKPALTRGAKMPIVHVADSFLWARQSKWDEAIAAMRRAIDLRPAFFPNHVGIGDLLMRKQAADEAALAYQQAVQLNPAAERAYNGLGLALEAKGEWDRASAAFAKAIQLKPKIAEFRLNLGNVLLRKGEPARALAELKEALALEPKNPDLLKAVGSALTRLQRPAEAVAPLRLAGKLRPADGAVQNSLGLALHAAGDFPAAIAAFQHAVRLQDKAAVYWNNLGVANRAHQQLAAAVEAHRRACELEPKNAQHHAELGADLRLLGSPAEALPALRRALDLRPDFAWAENEQGLALQQAGKLDEALAVFRQAISHQSNVAILHENLGRTLHALGQLNSAIAAFQEAVNLDGQMVSARFNLGRALFDKGEYRKAHGTLAWGAARMLTSRQPVDGATRALIERCDRLTTAEAKRQEIVAGKLTPATPAERLDFALFCAHKGHAAAAVGHFLRAFEASSPEAEHAGLHFAAALAALEAAAAATGDEPARLRRQALDWLRFELEIARKQPVGKTPVERAAQRGLLLGWRHHRALASVSHPAALANLPERERAEWGRFWEDVAAAAGIDKRQQGL